MAKGEYAITQDADGKVLFTHNDIPIFEMDAETARNLACLMLKYSGMEVSVRNGSVFAIPLVTSHPATHAAQWKPH